jgi:ankyrin repeat protein
VRRLLREGADPDAREEDGRTPIFSAVLGGSVGLLGLLLEAGADVNARDENGWTALHFAAHEYLPEMATLLLGRGADPNLADDGGCTALWRAIQGARGRYDVVFALLEHGARDDVPNAAGETPRQLAARLGETAFEAN